MRVSIPPSVNHNDHVIIPGREEAEKNQANLAINGELHPLILRSELPRNHSLSKFTQSTQIRGVLRVSYLKGSLPEASSSLQDMIFKSELLQRLFLRLPSSLDPAPQDVPELSSWTLLSDWRASLCHLRGCPSFLPSKEKEGLVHLGIISGLFY